MAHSDKLRELVGEGVEVERVATGFTFTEGPIWMPDGSLHFSDMPADKRRRWHPEEGVTVLRDPSNKCNGMTLDNDGNLIVCEHVTSSVVRESPDGRRETIASHWQGKELNSPNDVIVARDGSIIFTDPTYGRMPVFGLEREQELSFQGVYRLAAETGEVGLLVDDFAQPNGLCLSSDESLLFVNDTDRAHIRVFDVGPGHALSNGRVFAEGIGTGDMATGELVDGMKLDERGNVYVTGPGGVWVFDPAGEHIGTIGVPENVGNVNWGGDGWQTLYIPASTLDLPRPAARRRQSARLHAPRRPEGASMDRIDPTSTALVIQDLQNDVMIEGGAFADSGAPAHATSQNVVENVRTLAAACRRRGVPVFHVWYIVEPGAAGLKQNAPLFQGVKGANALVRGTWGAAPAAGLEPQDGDFVVEKMRMNALLRHEARQHAARARRRDARHHRRLDEHVDRAHRPPRGRCRLRRRRRVRRDVDHGPEWQDVALNYAMQNVASVATCSEIAAALGS